MGRKSLVVRSNRMQIGIASCAELVVDSRITNLLMFADNLANVSVEWGATNAAAQVVLGARSSIKVKLSAAGALNLSVVVGEAASFELVFAESFAAFDVDVRIKLARSARTFVATSFLSAARASKWKVDASALDERVSIKLVYSALVLKQCAVLVNPSFTLRSSSSACTHSVSVGSWPCISVVYLANRLVSDLTIGGLIAYSMCTASFG